MWRVIVTHFRYIAGRGTGAFSDAKLDGGVASRLRAHDSAPLPAAHLRGRSVGARAGSSDGAAAREAANAGMVSALLLLMRADTSRVVMSVCMHVVHGDLPLTSLCRRQCCLH